MKACRETVERLSRYLEKEVEPEEQSLLESHLEQCADCRAELELLRHTVSALRRLPDLPAPAGILHGVREGLEPLPWYRRLGRAITAGKSVRIPLGAAATLLVAGGIFLLTERFPELGQPPTAMREPAPSAPRPAPPVPEAATPVLEPSPSAPEAAAPAGWKDTVEKPVTADAFKGESASGPPAPVEGETVIEAGVEKDRLERNVTDGLIVAKQRTSADLPVREPDEIMQKVVLGKEEEALEAAAVEAPSSPMARPAPPVAAPPRTEPPPSVETYATAPPAEPAEPPAAVGRVDDSRVDSEEKEERVLEFRSVSKSRPVIPSPPAASGTAAGPTALEARDRGEKAESMAGEDTYRPEFEESDRTTVKPKMKKRLSKSRLASRADVREPPPSDTTLETGLFDEELAPRSRKKTAFIPEEGTARKSLTIRPEGGREFRGALGERAAYPEGSTEVLTIVSFTEDEVSQLRESLKEVGGRLLEMTTLDAFTSQQMALPYQARLPRTQQISQGWQIRAIVPLAKVDTFVSALGKQQQLQILHRTTDRARWSTEPGTQNFEINVVR